MSFPGREISKSLFFGQRQIDVTRPTKIADPYIDHVKTKLPTLYFVPKQENF